MIDKIGWEQETNVEPLYIIIDSALLESPIWTLSRWADCGKNTMAVNKMLLVA